MLWERAGDLVGVDFDGTKSWALAEDQPALVAPETNVAGVRLPANLDPLNTGRDRELLVPDPALRKRIWRVLGGPGTVLVGGEIGGLWRATKTGRKLRVTVEPLDALDMAAADELAAEADRIAPFRGAEAAELRTGTL